MSLDQAELDAANYHDELTQAILKIDLLKKVLEQALEALQWEHGGEPLPTLTTAAIAAIQGVLV